MNNSTDILIIGGGPAAAVCAGTAMMYYPKKKLTIIKNSEPGVIPCGIPYMVHSLEKPENNIMSFDPLKQKGIEVIVDEVVKIDQEKKEVVTKKNDVYQYEKLVLATGSRPITPKIDGFDLDNVFPIVKDFKYLKKMLEKVKNEKNILVIGGGFIGVEFADEISSLKDKNVYLIEMLPYLLPNSFDKEFADLAQEKLKEKGVNIFCDVKVDEIIGNQKVEKVKLSNGKELDIDVIISGLGAIPNVELAKDAGLLLRIGNGIWVDEYLRTSNPDIFAVGDCAGKRDFFTRKDNPVMLASTATAEARVAGANLYELKVVRENKGTIAIFSTYISGLVLASVGLTEQKAQQENFAVVMGQSEGIDKHPGTLPGNAKFKMKLVFSKQSGILMGGEVSGGSSASEIINIIGIAIQKNFSINELETLQMATHPYLTPPPTKYHIVMAAQDALRNM